MFTLNLNKTKILSNKTIINVFIASTLQSRIVKLNNINFTIQKKCDEISEQNFLVNLFK